MSRLNGKGHSVWIRIVSVCKSKFFVPAVSLMFFAGIFQFGPTGVTWFWSDQPIVAAILAGTSATF